MTRSTWVAAAIRVRDYIEEQARDLDDVAYCNFMEEIEEYVGSSARVKRDELEEAARKAEESE